MRVYISGPMTGKPDHNRPAFDAAEKRLTAQGHFVINPHRISALFGTADELAESFKVYYEELFPILPRGYRVEGLKVDLPETRLARAVMDADLAAVRSCDAIYLLRGWESSRGAKKELAEALTHGLQVMQEKNEKPHNKENT